MPYTPPVGTMLQLHTRLKHIVDNGGLNAELSRAKKVAEYFRSNIKDLPYRLFSRSMPNAVTALTPTNGRSAYDVVVELIEKHNIFVCPNGGALKDMVFRVSHMGDVDTSYTDRLLTALRSMK